MVKTIDKSEKDYERLLVLASAVSEAIIETLEKNKLTAPESFFVLKALMLVVFNKFPNSIEVAELFFKDLCETLNRAKEFKSKGGTFTLQ